MAHPYNDAGRRLMAAVLSYQMDIKMDYCLKEYVPQEVEEGWAELAETLLRGISGAVVENLVGEGPSEAETNITIDMSKLKVLTKKVQ